MNSKIITSVVAVLVISLVALVFAFGSSDADAQANGGYEYGYLISVPRLESYEIDKKRWAGSEKDKKYLNAHVFAYETGQTDFDRHVNSLRKINELSGTGWELVDAKVGLMRREK